MTPQLGRCTPVTIVACDLVSLVDPLQELPQQSIIQAGVTTPLVTPEVNRNTVLACDQSDSRSGRNPVVMTVVNRVLGVMMT